MTNPTDQHTAENDAGLWIEYGKHDNGFWIDAQKVASVRNIGKGGKRGSILTLDNGHAYVTGYPATQLVAMVADARRTRVIPPGVDQ
jgi:hypothetical protein